MTFASLTESLLRFAEGAAASAGGTALRWTPILLLAVVGARLSRSTGAAFRHAIWGTALVALAMMPLAGETLPRWEVPLDGAGAWSRVREATLARLPAELQRGARTLADDGAARRAAAAEGVPGGRLEGSGWPRRLALLWLAGICVGLLREAAQLARARRLLRGSSPDSAAMSRDVATRIGKAGGVDIWTGPIAIPAAIGAWRTRVLMPRGWRSWPTRWIEAALCHEVAHLERGDLRWRAFVRWLRLPFWFHPGVWWAARRLDEEAEAACDERVVERGLDRIAYAEALVQIAAAVRSARPPLPSSAAALDGPVLTRRVRSLLAREPSTRRRPRRAWLIPLAVLALLLGSGDVAIRAGTPRLRGELPLVRVTGGDWMLHCVPGDVACAAATHQAYRLLRRSSAGGVAIVAEVEDGRVEGYASTGGGEGAVPAVPRVAPGSLAKLALAAAWWESGLGDRALECPSMSTTTAGLRIRSTSMGPSPLIAPRDVLVYSCNSAAVAMAGELEARLGRGVLPSAMAPLLAADALAQEGPDVGAFAALGGVDWQAQAVGIGPLATTPMEVARLVQAAGNGGVATAPWAAAAAGARLPPRRLFSPNTARLLRDALDDAVRRGTAHEATTVMGGAPWRLGGKTGTVRNENGTTDGWFAGLLSDAAGQPRKVVVVWLRAGGPGGHEPTRLAARLARAVGG